ncbi:MAG: SGNH/GDSL hydrolase family protein [Candidatus Limnocylindrales bacterium]
MDTRRVGAPSAGTRDGEAPIYYLSLGDSLATGVQPIGDADWQFRTNDGYADQLDSIARVSLPSLRTVKLGYPGESTVTMIEGGLTAYPHGSQLDEAVAFLRGHRGSVAFVTIDIGFNDLDSYGFEALPAGMASIGRNLPGILGTLREAAGPETPVVGMTIYDAFLPAWLEGPLGREIASRSVWDAVVPLNAHLREIYGAAGLRLADVEGAFATTDFETEVDLAGVGRVPINVARACEWTWGATPPPLGPDLHANAGGYRAIAEAFARELLG